MDINALFLCVKSLNSFSKLGSEVVAILEGIGEMNLLASIRFLSHLDKAKDPKAELRSAVTTLVVAYESYCQTAARSESGIRALVNFLFPFNISQRKHIYEQAVVLSLLIHVIYMALGEEEVARLYLDEAEKVGCSFFDAWKTEITTQESLRLGESFNNMPNDDLKRHEQEMEDEKEEFANLMIALRKERE